MKPTRKCTVQYYIFAAADWTPDAEFHPFNCEEDGSFLVICLNIVISQIKEKSVSTATFSKEKRPGSSAAFFRSRKAVRWNVLLGRLATHFDLYKHPTK